MLIGQNSRERIFLQEFEECRIFNKMSGSFSFHQTKFGSSCEIDIKGYVVHTKDTLNEWWQWQTIQLIYFSVTPVKSGNSYCRLLLQFMKIQADLKIGILLLHFFQLLITWSSLHVFHDKCMSFSCEFVKMWMWLFFLDWLEKMHKMKIYTQEIQFNS